MTAAPEYPGWPEPPATRRRRKPPMPVGLAVTVIVSGLAAAAVAAVIAGSLLASSPLTAPTSESSTVSTGDMLVEGPVLAIEPSWETFRITSVFGVSLASVPFVRDSGHT